MTSKWSQCCDVGQFKQTSDIFSCKPTLRSFIFFYKNRSSPPTNTGTPQLAGWRFPSGWRLEPKLTKSMGWGGGVMSTAGTECSGLISVSAVLAYSCSRRVEGTFPELTFSSEAVKVVCKGGQEGLRRCPPGLWATTADLEKQRRAEGRAAAPPGPSWFSPKSLFIHISVQHRQEGA